MESDQTLVLTKLFKKVFWDFLEIGAAHEARTRDLNLGKVALYQLS